MLKKRLSSSDLSWPNEKPLWITLILALTLLGLHIIYKLTRCTQRRRHSTSTIRPQPQHDDFVTSTQTPVDAFTRFEEVDAGDGEVTRPLRTVMRHESDVSVLPRYERFDEGVMCGEGAELEKRGRYMYMLGGGMGRARVKERGMCEV